MSLTRPGHLCSVSYLSPKSVVRDGFFASPSRLEASLTILSELINIFEIFLPQLLRYPNPADPLNGEAAAILMRDPKSYAKKVESYVDRFATPEDADQAGDDDDEDEDQPMGGNSGRPKTMETATNGNGVSNGHSNGNGHANGTNGTNGADGEEDDDEDNMSDMGTLSDGDEFMGEMDE